MHPSSPQNTKHIVSQPAGSLWAKTGPGEDPTRGLSLAQHMRDSGQVAGCIWDSWISPGIKSTIAQQLHLTEDEVRSLYCWLAETHDIGKATPEFAGQLDTRGNEELRIYRKRIEEAGFDFPQSLTPPLPERCPHSTYSQSILTSWLSKYYESEVNAVITSFAAIAGAHHGSPAAHEPHSDTRRDNRALRELSTPWRNAWEELLTLALDHSGAEEVLDKLINAKTRFPIAAQFVLTGLVIMADWIASNADYFPMGTFSEQEQLDRARKGWEALGFEKAWEAKLSRSEDAHSLYNSRFQFFADNPQIPLHPMQEVAVQAARSLTQGGIMCIEAPMGQGKTEAGLIAAEILAQATGRTGLAFAAPTQATSNALLTRIEEWARLALKDTTDIHSLFLGHSKRNLNKDIRSLPMLDIFDDGEDTQDQSAQDVRSRIARHSWFSGTKRGMLSTFVVCTVDQVLMMALQIKHVMLRHVALSSKVVVIDEVHAYDAYMSEYLKEALYWLGCMNAPVILMSATLPRDTKEQLMKSYQRGLEVAIGQKPKRIIQRAKSTQKSSISPQHADLAYPVITTLGSGDSNPVTWDIEAPAKQQKIMLHQIDDHPETLRNVLVPLENGHGCAAIICNTVGRAQKAYKYLRDIYGDDVVLFHSRFLASHRVVKEERLVQELGKNAHRGDGRPVRRIVVGTQVIEQSLDLDFDVLVTDFAPVDLVLQRIGRLHRHTRDESERPEEFRSPMCYIRGFESVGSTNQAPKFVSDSTLIYESLILYTSYAQLLPYLDGSQSLQIPADMSKLVQGAYSIPKKGTPDSVPTAWIDKVQEANIKYQSNQEASRAKAQGYLLKYERSDRTMADTMSAMSYPQRVPRMSSERIGDEEIGEMRVRDIDDSLEVIALEVEHDETGRIVRYRAIPEQFDSDQPWFDVNTPLGTPSRVRSFASDTIRLPYQFADKPTRGSERGTSWRFNKALNELESFRIDAWQEEYLLNGQLILPFIYDEDNQQYIFDLVDCTLVYTQALGLRAIEKNK